MHRYTCTHVHILKILSNIQGVRTGQRLEQKQGSKDGQRLEQKQGSKDGQRLEHKYINCWEDDDSKVKKLILVSRHDSGT